jgi:hypothetical protein
MASNGPVERATDTGNHKRRAKDNEVAKGSRARCDAAGGIGVKARGVETNRSEPLQRMNWDFRRMDWRSWKRNPRTDLKSPCESCGKWPSAANAALQGSQLRHD